MKLFSGFLKFWIHNKVYQTDLTTDKVIFVKDYWKYML